PDPPCWDGCAAIPNVRDQWRIPMDVTVNQANLARATRLAGRATPNRSTFPVLQTVRLDAQLGRLTLTATDLELGVTTAIAANVTAPGAVCVPARLLGEYVAQL